MTVCYQEELDFGRVNRRQVTADFRGGEVSSNGGAVLLRQADARIGLTQSVARALVDPRRRASCRHSMVSLLRQRIYGLALGFEDVDDHDSLRHDLAIQAACGTGEVLGSSSTVGRVERRANRQAGIAVHEVLLAQFVASYDQPPDEIVLDFDATDDPVHGHQEGRFFHGYYDRYCFLPLYVTCGDHLLVSYLRPSNIDGAKHAWAILSLLYKAIRQHWPKVQIIVRGDSGFCRRRMLHWCEKRDVKYIVGIARNKRLEEKSGFLMRLAREQFERTGEKQRRFTSMRYAAKTWKCARKVIAKAEYTDKGPNPRFIVTNLSGDPQELYDEVYCARGEMENRIKEQMQLFSDRTSCHQWWPNQFRLLLSSVAYVLVNAIREIGLKGTKLARAQVKTIRLKLLKVGAVIMRNTRRIRIHMSSSYPHPKLFAHAARALDTG